MMPTTISVPSVNPPTRFRTKGEKDQVNEGAGCADGAQEAGVEALGDRPAVDRRHGEQGDGGDRSDQVKAASLSASTVPNRCASGRRCCRASRR